MDPRLGGGASSSESQGTGQATGQDSIGAQTRLKRMPVNTFFLSVKVLKSLLAPLLLLLRRAAAGGALLRRGGGALCLEERQFRIQRVQGLGFRVQGLGFRVQVCAV